MPASACLSHGHPLKVYGKMKYFRNQICIHVCIRIVENTWKIRCFRSQYICLHILIFEAICRKPNLRLLFSISVELLHICAYFVSWYLFLLKFHKSFNFLSNIQIKVFFICIHFYVGEFFYVF